MKIELTKVQNQGLYFIQTLLGVTSTTASLASQDVKNTNQVTVKVPQLQSNDEVPVVYLGTGPITKGLAAVTVQSLRFTIDSKKHIGKIPPSMCVMRVSSKKWLGQSVNQQFHQNIPNLYKSIHQTFAFTTAYKDATYGWVQKPNNFDEFAEISTPAAQTLKMQIQKQNLFVVNAEKLYQARGQLQMSNNSTGFAINALQAYYDEEIKNGEVAVNVSTGEVDGSFQMQVLVGYVFQLDPEQLKQLQ